MNGYACFRFAWPYIYIHIALVSLTRITYYIPLLGDLFLNVMFNSVVHNTTIVLPYLDADSSNPFKCFWCYTPFEVIKTI